MSGSGDGVALTPTPPPAGTGLPNLLSPIVLVCRLRLMWCWISSVRCVVYEGCVVHDAGIENGRKAQIEGIESQDRLSKERETQLDDLSDLSQHVGVRSLEL
jgi:hypothetical protein